MDRLSDRKIIVVTRKTRLEDLIVRFNSVSQARFYVEHLGADFNDYQKESEEYASAVAQACASLERFGRTQRIDRGYLSNFIFGKDDIVVSIGQDGLVANTLKYLDGQPLVGVNPSPDRWDGVLLPFGAKDMDKVMPEVIRNGRPRKEVTMAMASLNNGQSLLAVNDIFIGQRTHVSARYRIQFGEAIEQHSSSGIIVSTGLGSTGWLKSILAGSTKLVGSLEKRDLKLKSKDRFDWNSEYLYFSVREPFPSKATGSNLVFGKVSNQKPLKVLSQMAENGVLFSDGIESDYIEFNSGVAATITLADKKGVLIH